MTDMSKDMPKHIPLIHNPWLYMMLMGMGFLAAFELNDRYPKATPEVLWTLAMASLWWAACYSWWQWSNTRKWTALFRRWNPIVDNLRAALGSHDADKIIAACKVAEMDPSFMADKMNQEYISEARTLAAMIKGMPYRPREAPK